MRTNLKDVSCFAQTRNHAMTAFECVEDLMLHTILETCESLHAPTILMGLPGPDPDGKDSFNVPGLIRVAAERHAIPKLLVAACSHREWGHS
jgi:fructose/tagatose bisphosphate aldolase